MNNVTWIHLTVYKQIIDINGIISVRQEYMKPFDCVQTND